MNKSVWPVNCLSVPSAAAVSKRRTDVVPTATTRPPFCRHCVMRSAVSCRIVPHSECMRCPASVAVPIGRNVPAPVCSVKRADSDPVFLQATEQRLAEVQPGSRRGDRPGPAGVDRLILAYDRPRPFRPCGYTAATGPGPTRSSSGKRLFVALRADDPACIGLFGGQLDADVVLPLGVRQADPFAGSEMPAGLAQDSPHASFADFEEQALPMAAGAFAAAEQPGGNDLRVIQNQAIAGAQQFRQIADVVVRQRLALAVDDQQSSIDARRHRLLGNQMPRQFIVVLVDFAGHSNPVGQFCRMPIQLSISAVPQTV